MRYKLSVGERVLLAGTVGVLTVLATVAGASAASTTNLWKLGFYNANGNGFVFKDAPTGSFAFPTAPTAALLLTQQKPLTGNKLESTITATFTLNDAANTYTYGGEPSCGGTTAFTRLYFDSASIVGPASAFVSTNFWWSDDATSTVNLANGTFTVTALIDPTNAAWGAYNGEQSGSNTALFDAAASSIRDIGLSFGGGCFFANGVGTPDGTGTFVLNSFTVSP